MRPKIHQEDNLLEMMDEEDHKLTWFDIIAMILALIAVTLGWLWWAFRDKMGGLMP